MEVDVIECHVVLQHKALRVKGMIELTLPLWVGMCHDHIVEFYQILHHTASREPLCILFYKDLVNHMLDRRTTSNMPFFGY